MWSVGILAEFKEHAKKHQFVLAILKFTTLACQTDFQVLVRGPATAVSIDPVYLLRPYCHYMESNETKYFSMRYFAIVFWTAS